MPASNVSRHVAALERSLGVRLLERSTRHLRMTEAGRLLYQRAKPLLDTLAATAEELGAGEQALRGPLRMCMPGEAPLLLGPIIAEFCASHPGVELQCDTRMAGEQALREDMDLAIVFHRGDQDDSTLVTRELASLPSLVVGARADRPRRHAHAHGAAQDAALHHDLERAAGATLAFCGHRRTHGEGAGAQPLPRQQRRAGAGGRAPGIGYAILAAGPCQEDLAAGRLVEVPLELRPAPCSCWPCMAIGIRPARVYGPCWT